MWKKPGVPRGDKLQFDGLFGYSVGNAVLSVPTAKRHIFSPQHKGIIRILGHRTPKFFRNAEDSVPYRHSINCNLLNANKKEKRLLPAAAFAHSIFPHNAPNQAQNLGVGTVDGRIIVVFRH